ncbi:cystathionine beta-lyase [Sistotremastrum niveocremeum HHB9708]|uniref:Cystathionine beta-lyase n=1 Tax=Sistotremastrum niveocremeum HHB9708 TaxID=1314777 RepID=A0A164TM40_9AGAM|nr:cystathionine beta-lyase [Sistotremastrum niveocremeum HHB9708]
MADHNLPTPEPDSPALKNLNLKRNYHFSTQCVTIDSPDAGHKDQHGASSVPIYQSATFKGVGGEYDYSRSGNPTRTHLEHHLAKISGARHAFAVSSGMAALDVITRMLKPGDEVVAGDDLYGGTNRLLTYLKVHGGVKVHHVDTTDPTTLLPLLGPGTAMVLLESPTNPLLKIADLQKIAADVKERAPQAVIVVDNTMMSPYLQRPLEHGADIVYDSATKYLSGHHDLMAGVIVCNKDDLAKQMAFVINASGNALTPFDSFLLLRGTKTLAIRMDRQQSTAMSVASYLDQLGFKVNYPGLANHPGREIHERIANGPGAVLSFTTGDTALSERIVGATRLWGISVSFGAVNSLISMPCVMSHASIDPKVRKERGLPEDLIRLCVGIEDPADLLADLETALLEAGAIKEEDVTNGIGISRILPGGARDTVVSRAVEKLKFESNSDSLGLERDQRRKELLVSAPGKVILFGEHAVVHGVTAIAAAVDLRCYGHTTPLPAGQLRLTFPFDELDHFDQTWVIDKDLPWDAVPTSVPTPDVLDAKLLGAIQQSLLHHDQNETPARARAVSAAQVFLYIYMILASPENRPSLHLTVRSTLPLGAGLGSSASYSTCVASSLLLKTGHISVSTLSHSISSEDAEEVNRWAFTGEKILHGNPSGVDNSVAVFGGALAFTRSGFGRQGGMEKIQGFQSVRFLLTDSRVSRNTKKLVEGVALKKAQEPELVDGVLRSIQEISDRAKASLADPALSRAGLFTELEHLIEKNHDHLVVLGVSHPVLEDIRAKTREPHGLRTKLTGAGGGGCAVTLVPDAFQESALQDVQKSLIEAGYKPYTTSVGGTGLGVLWPTESEAAGPDSPIATPPQTPHSEQLPAAGIDLKTVLATGSDEDLADRISRAGKWIFV